MLTAVSDDTTEKLSGQHIDLRASLAPDSKSTVVYEVTGDSMNLAGIFQGDRVLVNRSAAYKYGDMVVAYIPPDGYALKRLVNRKGVPHLAPESNNARHKLISINDAPGASILGVATTLIRSL